MPSRVLLVMVSAHGSTRGARIHVTASEAGVWQSPMVAPMVCIVCLRVNDCTMVEAEHSSGPVKG